MGKKQTEATPNVNSTANRDVVQRLNFLYQASVYLQSIAPPPPPSKGKGKQTDAPQLEPHTQGPNPAPGQKTKQRKPKKRTSGMPKTTGDIARTYVHCMRAVAQKSTVKMDPSLKRSLCANCSTTLVIGTSASVRVKPSQTHGHMMAYTCLHCKTTKRIPAPPTLAAADPPSDAMEGIEGPSIHCRNHDRIARHLPLFARPDAGHVVFRGNERVAPDEAGGLGVAFV